MLRAELPAVIGTELVLSVPFVTIVLHTTHRRAPAGFAPLAIGVSLGFDPLMVLRRDPTCRRDLRCRCDNVGRAQNAGEGRMNA